MQPEPLTPEGLAQEPTKEELYRAQFIKLTGHKPASEVKMGMRIESRRYFVAGLEAQVEFKDFDGGTVLKTIFTPVKRYLRDNNKFVPDHNQKVKQDESTDDSADNSDA